MKTVLLKGGAVVLFLKVFLKKKSKMMVEEFDVCHKFSEKIKREIIPHEQRENCEFTHNVSCSELKYVKRPKQVIFFLTDGNPPFFILITW